VDEVWVASEFCRHAFSNHHQAAGETRIPLVVDGLEEKVIYHREHFQTARRCVRVSATSSMCPAIWTARNPFCLIEAFKREFGNSRDVSAVSEILQHQTRRR